MKHVAFDGRLLILGFGSIGQGVLPLILRHVDMPAERIMIVTGEKGIAVPPQRKRLEKQTARVG